MLEAGNLFITFILKSMTVKKILYYYVYFQFLSFIKLFTLNIKKHSFFSTNFLYQKSVRFILEYGTNSKSLYKFFFLVIIIFCINKIFKQIFIYELRNH